MKIEILKEKQADQITFRWMMKTIQGGWITTFWASRRRVMALLTT